MQTSSLVKKRLNDLKMLSQNLKQSTEVRKDLDLNLIKAIFDITKTIHKQQSRVQNNPILNISTHQSALQIQKSSPNSLGSSKLTKNISHSILPKYINKTQSFDYSIDEQNIQPLFLQKSTSPRQIPSYKKIANTHQEQLIHLRQLNYKLQIQVRQMKQQLIIYKQKQQMQRQKMYRKQQVSYHNINWNEDSINNSHPYFQLYEQIQLFSTKLSINNQDYPKIDYIKSSMRLTLDKILIKKDISSSTNSSKNLSKDNNSSIQQLKIINIIQVNYLSNNYMMILFSEGDNQDKTRLFLHFTDEQTLHRWDLGIFINFKIITSLTVDKLFQRQKQKQKKIISDLSKLKQEKQNNSQIQEIFENSQDAYIIKKYLENKQRYIESQKNLKKDWLQRISQKKRASKQQKLNLSLKHTKSQQKLLQLPLQNDIYFNDEKIEQTKLAEVNSAIVLKNDNINNNFMKKQNNHIEKQLQNSIQKINKQHKSVQELQQIKLEEQKRKQQQQRLMKVQQAFQVVKKGMFMTKYAKGAMKPHQKKVYISPDNKKLCWQDKDSFQFKHVLVSEIISINRGEIGEGVQTHLDIKKIKNENCFLKINLNSKQRKNLQFSMTSLKLMDKFCESLIIFLSQIRKQNQQSK